VVLPRGKIHQGVFVSLQFGFHSRQRLHEFMLP
jgi:hypothetical protein